MPINSVPFIKSCITGLFRLLGQHHRAAGRRSGALFFALHRDYFVMTRNFAAVYRDLLPFRSFTVTRSSLPFTGTGKKQVTATQTAPNQTAGPLWLIISIRGRYKQISKSIWILAWRRISKQNKYLQHDSK